MLFGFFDCGGFLFVLLGFWYVDNDMVFVGVFNFFGICFRSLYVMFLNWLVCLWLDGYFFWGVYSMGFFYVWLFLWCFCFSDDFWMNIYVKDLIIFVGYLFY